MESYSLIQCFLIVEGVTSPDTTTSPPSKQRFRITYNAIQTILCWYFHIDHCVISYTGKLLSLRDNYCGKWPSVNHARKSVHFQALLKSYCYCLVSKSCPTLCNPVDYSPPGSSVYGVLQAKILEWVAMPFSRGSSQPRDWIQVSHIAGGFFTVCAIRKQIDSTSLLRLLWEQMT